VPLFGEVRLPLSGPELEWTIRSFVELAELGLRVSVVQQLEVP